MLYFPLAVFSFLKLWTVLFTLHKKNRKFQMHTRFGAEEPAHRGKIVFERLPRKRLKSIWWHVLIFGLLVYLIHYLRSF
ncbi:MAG: hypothetical protein D6677_03805 [Calditrichaeota bacterium]|nr:MAG: hypothetical protein D6677_03805 [Calditrichota bacterium]